MVFSVSTFAQEGEHAAGWVCRVQMPKVRPCANHDVRVLVLAGEMKEINHELECRIAHRLYERESFRR